MNIDKKYKYEWCLNCNKDHSDKQDEEVCKCGGRNFLFGDTIIQKDGRYICTCGNDELKQMFRLNHSLIYDTTYRCTSCGANVGKQIYYENPYV